MMKNDDESQRLIWIDLEMTGLDPDTDVIIEIATLVTDKDLNVLAEGPELAIRQSLETLEAMDDVDDGRVVEHSEIEAWEKSLGKKRSRTK